MLASEEHVTGASNIIRRLEMRLDCMLPRGAPFNTIIFPRKSMINKSLSLTSKLPTSLKQRSSRPPHHAILISPAPFILSFSHLHIYCFTVWKHLLYGLVSAKPRPSWPPGRETCCMSKYRPHCLMAYMRYNCVSGTLNIWFNIYFS